MSGPRSMRLASSSREGCALGSAEALYQDFTEIFASIIFWCRKRLLRSRSVFQQEGRCGFWRSAAQPAGRPVLSFEFLPQHCTEYVFTDISPRFHVPSRP